ncbi:MAG: ABC transporter ATP-binding protein, partial [Peptococcaceae bacterium]|nr:ABC transporter ATP-binding protein [Peptococcaceae bacterium]
VLALLQRPDSGELFINGERVVPQKELHIRRRMAVVFQEPLLLDTTVYQNVASGLFIRGHQKSEIDAKVREWLERLGIAAIAHRPARFLSGGESQRVSLARAFVLNPEVLFLDEPFSALDYPTRRSLIAELGDILRATRISTILVTHDYTEIPALANMVTVLLDGRVAQCCTPQELFARPASETVAALVGPPGRRGPSSAGYSGTTFFFRQEG